MTLQTDTVAAPSLRRAQGLSGAARRRGVSTLWLLLLLPVLVIALCVVLEIGNLWLARAELENGLEAAALAAVEEWGDAGGGDTLTARNVGVDFAGANAVSGVPLAITTNYNPAHTNDNDSCEGDLVFGAITEIASAPPGAGGLFIGGVANIGPPETVFDAGVEPSCFSGAAVLFDVTNQGNVAADNSWGISFRATNNAFLNNNLRIVRVVIDVDFAATGDAFFDFSSAAPVISNNFPQPKVMDQDPTPPNSQPDNVGFIIMPGPPPTSDQIDFSPTAGTPTQLTIDFSSDGGDTGFNPGDRFRFGASVRVRRGSGFGQASGDDIGQIPTKVTVFFELTGNPILPPTTGFFMDNRDRIDRRNQCIDNTTFVDPLGQVHQVVHGRRIVDLPCPATSSANNNGQSFVELSGSGPERPFAVHAQKQVEVSSICCNLFGIEGLSFTVMAETVAVYDCNTCRPRLIHVDKFLCP